MYGNSRVILLKYILVKNILFAPLYVVIVHEKK